MNRVMIKKDVHWGHICVIACIWSLLSACVYDEDRMAYLNDQYSALNKRVTQLQDSQKDLDARVGKDLDAKLGTIGSSASGASREGPASWSSRPTAVESSASWTWRGRLG